MEGVGPEARAEGLGVAEGALQVIPGEGLLAPFAFADDDGLERLVEPYDIDLMIGIPPGSNATDADRERILETALDLIAERGIHGTSLQDLSHPDRQSVEGIRD